MAATLVTNIKKLFGVRTGNEPLRGELLAHLPEVTGAFLLIEDGVIADHGLMTVMAKRNTNGIDVIDAKGAMVLPAWCDSHTHLVFAGSREGEFVDRIKGLSYAQIAERGGGILNSAKKIHEISEDELFVQSWQRLQDVMKLGTGSVEIKSGYGLNLESELKILRVIKRMKDKSSLCIKSTFLGAHTYPVAFREDHRGYLDMIINEMLPVIAAEKLADYIDVFCETGFFSPQETTEICLAGKRFGLNPKLHVNQLNSIGGIEAGIKLDALSLDHLETLTDHDIESLQHFKGICTLLPTAAFFLRMPFQPARRLIEAGCSVALASDYNPGSSPSGNMNFVVALSCIQMKMLPEEAINAATINGAHAMGVGHISGSISKGKKASLIFTKPMPSIEYLPYSFGSNLIDRVMINGEFV